MKKVIAFLIFLFVSFMSFAAAQQDIAYDDFESRGWNGGFGNWESSWYHEGDSKIVSEVNSETSQGFLKKVITNAVESRASNPSGTYRLRLRRNNGYADRLVLIDNGEVSLSFFAKVESFESSDFANILVSEDGVNWNVLKTFNAEDSDSVYHFYEFDLSSYGFEDRFWVAIDAEMSNTGDFLYLDDVRVFENSGEEPPQPPFATWHIQFNPTPVNPATDVQYWNLDMFDVPTETMQNLKSEGVYVMCYFSAGSWENWRPDAGEFPQQCLGNNNGWPGEKWLDTRCPEVRQIMINRIDLGIQKGCDGFDPDNMDAYSNNPGFPITEQDGIDYYNFLADYAHSQGKGIGLKNALTIINEVLPNIDWAINEQCYQYNECYYLDQVVDDGKPVFQLEYGSVQRADEVCAESNFKKYSTLVKNQGLDAFEIACWQWAEVNVCGNGFLEGLEICDDGEENGEIGFCNLRCDGITHSPDLLAADDFESRDWNGGMGNWNGGWYHGGGANTQVLSSGAQQGTYHMMLKRANGYADRQANLEGEENVRVSFYAKVEGFETADFAQFLVGNTGELNVIKTFNAADSDGLYRYYEFDLVGNFSNQFYVAFDAQMNQDNDRVYFDDLKITSL